MKKHYDVNDLLGHLKRVYEHTKFWVLEDVFEKDLVLSDPTKSKTFYGCYIDDRLSLVSSSQNMEKLLGTSSEQFKIRKISRKEYEEFRESASQEQCIQALKTCIS